MIIDTRNQFAAAVSKTSTGQVGDIIDLEGDRDIGPGRPLWWVNILPVAPESDSANETYTLELETDSDEAFGTAETIATLTVSRSDAAGTQHVMGFPFANKRYLRVKATIGGTIGGTGLTLTSFITDQEPRKWDAQPDAI